MKKIVSLFIAITLILALCPLSFAADTFDGYTYVFSNNALKENTESYIKSFIMSLGYDSLNSEVTAPWKPASVRTINEISINGNGLGWKADSTHANGVNVVVIELKVEKGGKYKSALTYSANRNSPIADIWMVEEGTVVSGIKTDTIKENDGDCNELYTFVRNLETSHKLDQVNLWADYDAKNYTNLKTIKFDKTLDLKEDKCYYLIFSGFAQGEGYEDYSTNKNKFQLYINSFSLTPIEDEELSAAFDDAVKTGAPNGYIAPSVDAIDAGGIVGAPVPVSGGAYKITAAETSEGKGAFLYWKKAMTTSDKIVSFAREFNYVPEGNERNILIAVYEGDIKSTFPKCYNANGQYLPDAEPIDEDLPSMAGYGKAYKWEQYGDTNVWVAQYIAETPMADIDVTVIGDNTSGGGTDLAYGAEVTCTATGENFKCWKKTYGDGTAKIVSTNAEYIFNAWEDCTVEAIYAPNVHYTGSKIKIVIDNFAAGDETGVMAEFIGFGNNVVEKGIMFGDNRIAMTTTGNQFAVIADEQGTYKGYAIVENATDNGYSLITDGEYTK